MNIKKLIGAAFLLLISTSIDKQALYASKVTPYEQKNTKYKWPEICNNYKNAVVQVISFVNVFNLSDPSKTGSDQFVGSGSGFFINDDGSFLTNFHVIKDAPVIKVRMPSLGERLFDVEIIGCVPQKDFALLKLTPASLKTIKELLKVNELPYCELSDADDLGEATKVMALGYPLGQRNLKSSIGNVSGRESLGEIGECIQTTAPINPGNSGGPFLDETGKVKGIATLKILDAEGVGYFIPSNTIKTYIEDLQKNKKKVIEKPSFGLELLPTTDDMLKFLKTSSKGGMYVRSVQKGSLAEAAGIKNGDLILTINGYELDKYGYISPTWRNARLSLGDFVSRLKIEEIVKVKIWRDEKEIEITAQIPDEELLAIRNFHPWLEEVFDFERIGGLVVSQMTLNHIYEIAKRVSSYGLGDISAIQKYLKTKNRTKPKVIISGIYPGSVVSDVFSFDDVIIKKVNGLKVRTIEDFRNAVIEGCRKSPEYLTIENERGTFVVLSVKDLVMEEAELVEKNYLNPSNLIEILAKKIFPETLKTLDCEE